MKVTVTNRVEVSEEISREQIENYMTRTGWTVCCHGHVWTSWLKEDETGCEHGASLPMRESYGDYEEMHGRTIVEIAMAEGRQPGDVLRDVANEAG